MLDCFTLRDNFHAVQTAEIVRRRIALVLDERGIKKLRFAKEAGRKAPWVTMFLNGERPFPFDRIDEIARFLHLTAETLIAPLSAEEVRRSSELLNEPAQPKRSKGGR